MLPRAPFATSPVLGHDMGSTGRIGAHTIGFLVTAWLSLLPTLPVIEAPEEDRSEACILFKRRFTAQLGWCASCPEPLKPTALSFQTHGFSVSSLNVATLCAFRYLEARQRNPTVCISIQYAKRYSQCLPQPSSSRATQLPPYTSTAYSVW